MEAKDLRVGNYIERHNKVNGEKDIVQVDGGTPLIAFEGMTTLKFNPIPLTEEWLLKFGFKKFGAEFTNKSKFWIDGGNAIWKNSTICEVNYVHQLQNLYFALASEELTLHNGSR